MQKRKRRKDKKTKKVSRISELEAMWAQIVEKHSSYPKFAGKWGTLRGAGAQPAQAPAKATPAPARRPAAYVPTQPSPSTASARKAAFIKQFGQDAWDKREAAAREVKHTVMPGHKQGYELVTDPEMIKQMGKKIV